MLIVFAGRARTHNLASALRERGFEVIEIDTLQGGRRHDVTIQAVLDALVRDIEAGVFAGVFLATPCASYSVLFQPLRRTLDEPYGVAALGKDWAAYLLKHNTLAIATATLALAANKANAFVMIENPARRSDPASPACWRDKSGVIKHPQHCSLFDLPVIQQLAVELKAAQLVLPQCWFGGQQHYQKWTVILASRELIPHMRAFMGCTCTHPFHGKQATGLDENNRSLAELAAEYPQQMDVALAEAMDACCEARLRRQQGDERPTAAHASGGRIAEGPALHPQIAQACQQASLNAPRFASTRNLQPAAASELLTTPFPWTLHANVAEGSAGKKKKQKGRPLPPPAHSMSGSANDTRPSGKVSIEQLYYADVYESTIVPWLRLAAQAMTDVAAGRAPPTVKTLVVPQTLQPLWARGVVYDCSDPNDCVPVKRSAADTAHAGAKQIDKAAFRAMADAIGSTDSDIVDQVCGGGLEPRSEVSMDTVLSFHHKGVAKHFTAVNKIYKEELDNEWVTAPVAHLPYVPIKVIPKNVVMQERPKVADSGELQLHLKPRVTTDLSDGAEDSVNAGVPTEGRQINLPRAQSLAQAAAIIEAMCTGEDSVMQTHIGSTTSAELYAADAESAFRYMPVQHADLYTQGSIWVYQRADGTTVVGVYIDTRLCFGGSYAVNRFERVTTIIAAHARMQQIAFDRANPPPGAVQEASERRLQLVRAGVLPRGESQEMPGFCMVYVDDWNGSSTNDEVPVPPSIQHVGMPSTTRRPAQPLGTAAARVEVHCGLLIHSIRLAGLRDAEPKTQVGRTIVSLGLQVNLNTRRIVCPEARRTMLMEQLRTLRAAVATNESICTATVATLTGRLVNISQVEPELVPHLRAGYALANARAVVQGVSMPLAIVKQRQGGNSQRDWSRLLEAAHTALTTNRGVPLATAAQFHSRTEAGTITVLTDASGEDGFGGWATSPMHPWTVFVVSEPWSSEAKTALANAARPRRERDRSKQPTLSMPAAEAFAAVGTVAAVATQMLVKAVYAIGDCQPAVHAINASASANPQMAAMVQMGTRSTSQWLAVHVKRELNLDADRLSHPSQLAAVTRDAHAAHMNVVRLRLPRHLWLWLDLAIQRGCEEIESPNWPA